MTIIKQYKGSNIAMLSFDDIVLRIVTKLMVPMTSASVI